MLRRGWRALHHQLGQQNPIYLRFPARNDVLTGLLWHLHGQALSMNLRSLMLFLGGCSIALNSGAADAWGRDGHAIVAAIAYAHLSEGTRTQVDALLAVEPGATFVSVASWADEVKNRTTARWHFVNFPAGDCNYQPQVECRGGDCLVAAVDRETRVLRDTRLPAADREVALKYLIHLGGDGFQPLHSWGPQRGANGFQVRFDGRGTNLHAVWDTGLIKVAEAQQQSGLGGSLWHALSRQSGESALARALISTSEQLRTPMPPYPVMWVEQACHVANEPGLFQRDIDNAYERKWVPVVETQLIEAGVALANYLNTVLDNRDAQPTSGQAGAK